MMTPKRFMSAIAVALAFGLASVSAHALTVSWEKKTPSELATEFTNATNDLDDALFSFNADQRDEGSVDARSPWTTELTADSEFDREFVNVRGPGLIIHTLPSALPEGSLIWGSPDTYNSLFLFRGVDLIGTITPGDSDTFGIVDPIDTYVVSFSSPERFDTVLFWSGKNSFEFSNFVATPIPPAAILFLSGLLAIFGIGWRRNRVQTGSTATA